MLGLGARRALRGERERTLMPTLFLDNYGNLLMNAGGNSLMFDAACCCTTVFSLPCCDIPTLKGVVIGGGPFDGTVLSNVGSGVNTVTLCSLTYTIAITLVCTDNVWQVSGGFAVGAAAKAGMSGVIVSGTCSPFNVLMNVTIYSEGDTPGFNTLVACLGGTTFQVRFTPP